MSLHSDPRLRISISNPVHDEAKALAVFMLGIQLPLDVVS